MPVTVTVGRPALLRASTTLACALACVVTIEDARADAVVVTRAVPAVHFLDDDMLPVSSFPVAGEYVDGVATDGLFIYLADPLDSVLAVYDFAGVQQFQFDLLGYSGFGVELVGDELAVVTSAEVDIQDDIDFYDRVTGAYIRTIPGPPSAIIEGLGFDGEVLWVLENRTVTAVDPADGTVVTSVPNPAAACLLDGSGVSASAAGELTVVCPSGDWFVISSDDGALVDSGNNGLDMYGSDSVPQPECGDGVLDPGEECDEFGLSSECDIDCTFIVCGDGVIAPLADEECDDGNLDDGDGCSATCTAELPATTDGGGTSDATATGGSDGTTDGDTSSGGESSSDGSTSIAETLGASSGPAADESDSTAASESDGGGCGCTSAPNDSLAKLMPLAVLLLLRRRRR